MSDTKPKLNKPVSEIVFPWAWDEAQRQRVLAAVIAEGSL